MDVTEDLNYAIFASVLSSTCTTTPKVSLVLTDKKLRLKMFKGRVRFLPLVRHLQRVGEGYSLGQGGWTCPPS